jgi:hypothetical protein
MNKKIRWIYLLLFIALVSQTFVVSAKEKEGNKDKQLYKNTTNDYSNYITINQIFMWCKNNGDGCHDPRTDGQGFYWPGGDYATLGAVYEDGLIWAGKIGREVRMNGNTHRQGLQAGKILDNGEADDPGLSKYRVYKIRKTWESFPPGSTREQYEKDLEEWPVEDGAPWEDKNGNGVYDVGEAQFIGDEVLWYVANDLDPTRSTRTYGSQPIGLEQQCTIFGFQRTGDLGDIVFKKYKMINKGQNTVTDMYFGMWTDTDLGDGNDDYTGCDTVLSLGYTYNGTNNDATYGTAPPAMGYDFFQGPIVKGETGDSAKFDGKWRKSYKNLPMTAFTMYINPNTTYQDPDQGQYSGTLQFYYYLKGKVWNGNDFIDPTTNQPTVKVLYGDPVAGTGWYEGKGWPGGSFAPGDRRHLMSSGPFTMAPGDTQEIVVGLIIARGTNNLNSITELKRKDRAAQIAYDLNFKLTDPPEQPVVHTLAQDQAITLWWESNAESYKSKDPILADQITVSVNGKDTVIQVTNKNYVFEGYRVWQFSDAAGSNPKLLAVYDIKNGISNIYNFRYDLVSIDGQTNPNILLSAPNDGIRRFINISSDAYTNGPLYDGTPYYFGVTAYGISKYSDPPYLECTPTVIEVRPSKRKSDLNSPFKDGQNLIAEHTAGVSDGKVTFKVVDPQSLTGHRYKVVIKGQEGGTTLADTLRYFLIDVTAGDTLLSNMKDFVTSYVSTTDYNLKGIRALSDTINKPVIQGFQVFVQNVGRDSINSQPTKYRVKDVVEIKGPDGAVLPEPVNVFNELNSTKKWMIKAKGTLKRLIWQASKSDEGLGYNDYEIRFGPPESCMFYTSGYKPSFNPVLADDSVGLGTLPFEIWNIGQDVNSAADDTILTVKIIDYDRADTNRAIRDKKWTQLISGPNAGDWEEIFAYRSSLDPHNLLLMSGKSKASDHAFGSLSFSGEQPAQGTVIRITSYKPLIEGNQYEATLVAADFNDKTLAKSQLDKITVFPNPYFGANAVETSKYERIIRFTNLPKDVVVRIYSLAGIFIRRLEKSDNSPWLDWDLRNRDGLPVSSGMYIAYLEMPGVGTKILKLAVILETQYIDRL